MKFSIITPEHNPNNPYLYELYESICAQTYANWEWILFLNNGGWTALVAIYFSNLNYISHGKEW